MSDNHEFRMLSVACLQYFNMQAALIMAYMNFSANENLRFRSQSQSSFEFSTHLYIVGPYDEYNMRWYVTVGMSILLAVIFQIFFPHIGLILNSCKMGILRCYDRSYTCNNRKTRQITQEEYEDLYTGPEYILQLRFAQVLGLLFTTMTYSSGMPILYPLAFLTLLITFWTDKVLVSRYFRKENGFTADLSRQVVNMLPYTVMVHMPFGYL